MNAREKAHRSAAKLRIIDGRAQFVVDPIAPARGVILGCALGARLLGAAHRKRARVAVVSKATSSGSPGFFGFLTLLFIGLKLGGVIQWSWWWVLSPFLIPLAVAAFFGAIWLVLRTCESKSERNARELRQSLERMQQVLRRRS